MSKPESYRNQKLPEYIERLKNMVVRNFEIMIKPVDSVITEDKFYNILKGRKMAAEQSIWGAKKVDSCYKELNRLNENELSSYYRETIPELIKNLKIMFELNLEVIYIELDDGEDGITDDKLHNVIKSRKVGAEDSEWALMKIDELETELNSKEEDNMKVSWAIKGLVNEE